MAKGKRDGLHPGEGIITGGGAESDGGTVPGVNVGRTARAGRTGNRVIQVDPSVAKKKKIPPKRAAGLSKKKTDGEEAGERAGKKLGRPLDSTKAPEILPFEATLAYVFRNSGGKETAINAARLLTEADERFRRFVYAYDTASEIDKKSIRLEDLCGAADITPDEFLSKTVPALWKRNMDMGRMIAAISHPDIVEASIRSATKAGTFGAPDRKMLFEATGFLPTKNGPTINIDNSKKTLNVGGNQVEDTGAPALPSFEEEINLLAEVTRDPRSKLLAPPTEEQIIEVPQEAELV